MRFTNEELLLQAKNRLLTDYSEREQEHFKEWSELITYFINDVDEILAIHEKLISLSLEMVRRKAYEDGKMSNWSWSGSSWE